MIEASNDMLRGNAEKEWYYGNAEKERNGPHSFPEVRIGLQYCVVKVKCFVSCNGQVQCLFSFKTLLPLFSFLFFCFYCVNFFAVLIS